MKKYPTSTRSLPYKKSNRRFWVVAGIIIIPLAILGFTSLFHDLKYGHDEVITKVTYKGVTYELHAQVSWDNYCTPLNYVKVLSQTTRRVTLATTNTGPCPAQRGTNNWLEVGDYNNDGKIDFKVLKDSLNTPSANDYLVYVYSPSAKTYLLK